MRMKLIVFLVLIAQLSCASTTATCQDPKNAQSAACIVEGSVVDCTGVSSLPSAVAVVEPIVQKLILSAMQPNGTVNWTAIEPQLIDLALQYGTCTVAEVWNSYGSEPAGSARVARALPAGFAAEFDRIRAKVSPGRKFKTNVGTL